MSGICYDPNGWMSVDSIYVKERYLGFTHWVTVPLQMPLLVNNPSNPGGPAAEPAQDLVCPAGTSK